ncbi:Methyltransferase-related [Olea europaea subsp. europaea]|uniref:Methyltransferase-related n=1 Tax=Olea europaea subsp. europaea TaxID=158383 RepID=A0A8S0UT06_OLEEU|nr:Methyltransferase-related [Olea europaea subsp. europaea]
MCPLRFILVFFSAALAGYLAWRTVSSLPPELEDSTHENMSTTARGKQEFGFVKIIRNGFWVFIDMASGRYLWKNIGQLKNEGEEAKTH